jgi:glycosyltransferase involved in cell wall biosynthesis
LQPGTADVIEGKSIGVVIPAYNEERLLPATLAAIPAFVDRIYVVDDASRDSTSKLAHSASADDPRVVVVVHQHNGGPGAAVVTGYRRTIQDRMDVICVMNGDNQMDPDELSSLVSPVARGEVDYAKANRLFTGQAWEMIPRHRYLGNAVLSLLTKIASGYWHVADSQAGYTAIALPILERINLDQVYKRFGYPNDMLVHLNIWNARVRDVPSRPIYGIGERSEIRVRKVVPRISWLLFKRFWWRMWHKYVIRDFHPLVFFYAFGVIMSAAGLGIGIWQTVGRMQGEHLTAGSVVLVALFLLFGLLFTLFAMWFDMETNKDLR